jgi:Zn-dependent protease
LQGRLTLNPIKHIDPFLTILLPLMLALAGAPIFGGAKPVPFNPQNVRFGEWGAALIALAGPLTNFLVAFLFFGIWVVVGAPDQGIWNQIFGTIISVNLGFFIFNMLPIPPLDGSRVLYALAPEFVRRGMEAIERFGIIIVFVIILFTGSAFGSFMVDVISFFLNLFGHVFRF